jgi:exodeoxyribonuclease V gamma subunit
MLTLFYSNRYEALTEALLDGLSRGMAANPSPWTREAVIVPSAAVRRRLELDVAERFGICANLDFTYLAQWIWARIGAVIPVPEQSPFAPERLTWRCYRLLDPAHARGCARLDAYLSQAHAGMRYELAGRVATVLDHYLTYRPEWLAAWQRGASIFDPAGEAARLNLHLEPRLNNASATQREDEQWQAALWREVLAEVSAGEAAGAEVAGLITPPAYRFLALAPQLDLDAVARAGWPERVSVFALPTMPPLQVALLRELARWIDVRMYVFNPCREYWTDILPQAQVDALALRDEADYHAVGNPLLAEWGRQTQAQLHMLQELTEGAAGREASYFEANAQPSWLAACQNAILDLTESPAAPASAEAGLEVHACHSLSRQLEVLHDRLLSLFESDPALQPADVMVAIADLAAAAPLIDAVFGTAVERRRIPYRISGLPPSRANPLARMLLDMLAAPAEAISASQVIEWLRVEAVAAQYRIAAAELETAQQWLAAAGARRGLEPQAPQAEVPVARHTLADALLRLYLGYALPDAAEPVADWLPIQGADGAQADLLGRLSRCVDDLLAFTRACEREAAPAEWADLSRAALDTFFAPELEFADSLDTLRDAIDRLAGAMEDGAAGLAVPAAVWRAALAATLDDPARGGVPWGGVTFSALTSLRGLPFKVICLLDLNDGTLPSVARADEFDLIAAFPKLGDRQRRDDERNLFLDALLAARERLLIFYTGRSIRDNAPLPPAALVAELLDYIARARAGEGASAAALQAARRALLTEHPLQPFAAQYALQQDGLYTYDAERSQIAAALADPAPRARPPFFAAALPASADTEIEFAGFERFWRHPIRHLLRERLGIALFDADAALADNAPFTLDWSGRDALAARLLPVLLSQGERAHAGPAARIAAASPELPDGATGAIWRERALHGLTELADEVQQACRAGTWRMPFALALAPRWPAAADAGGASEMASAAWQALAALAAPATAAQPEPLVLSGVLPGVGAGGLVIYRYARPTARDYLSAWLAHLVLCASAPAGVNLCTRWFGEAQHFELTPVADAPARLAELLALYQAGLRMPLHFFPKSAWAYLAAGPSEASKVWQGSPFSRGEAQDAYLELALRDLSTPAAALNPVFEQLARVVFGPLAEHLREAEAP